MADYSRCPNCGRRMTWELDAYGGFVCWPCADAEDPEDEAWWESLLHDETYRSE